jgi:hypothetical protein
MTPTTATTAAATATADASLYDAMTAYLGPLLEKHKAKQEIVFEDLISAKQASDKICKNMGKISVVVSTCGSMFDSVVWMV